MIYIAGRKVNMHNGETTMKQSTTPELHQDLLKNLICHNNAESQPQEDGSEK